MAQILIALVDTPDGGVSCKSSMDDELDRLATLEAKGLEVMTPAQLYALTALNAIKKRAAEARDSYAGKLVKPKAWTP